MNPPPSIAILQGIKSSDVDEVSFYRYEAHLTFENRNRLSFSASFRFSECQLIADAPIIEFPLTEANIVRVLGSQVSEVTCDTDGTLELKFANGYVLIIYANDPAYEAYTISIGEKEHVV